MNWTILKILGVFVLIYLGLILLVSKVQRSMIYFPTQASEKELRKIAKQQQLDPLENETGEIIGWKTPVAEKRSDRKVIMVFHGNAGHALHREYFINGFLARLESSHWQVILFEYPGYGSRPGKPSERVIKQAAKQALEQVNTSQISELYLVGESLGCGVASYLAGQFPDNVDGLMLVNAYPSLVDVAQHHYSFLPVRWLLREQYDNREALQSYTGPIAFIYGDQDQIIPPQFTREIHDWYEGPKSLIAQPGRTHNTMNYAPQTDWWQTVLKLWGQN
ncbi:MAG: alpha/beta hydrolase [Bacteroidota bacterium]